MALTEIICGYCERRSLKEAGAVNRARRGGFGLYCDRTCAGLGRRFKRTKEEKVTAKAEYDRQRREQLGEILLVKKRAAYHAAVAANPEIVRAKEREHRQKNMGRHVEYCRRPEYRAWKRDYDRSYRARQDYGPFAEAFLTLQELEQEIAARATRYDIYAQNGLLNKAKGRKNGYAQTLGG